MARARPRASSGSGAPQGNGGAPRKPRAPRRESAAPRAASSASVARRRGGGHTGLVAAGVVALLVGVGLYAGNYLITPHRGRGAPVRVAMPAERSADAVALALYRAGVIDRPWLFAWIMTLTGTTDRVPSGALALRDDLTPRAVLRALAAGVGLVRVTIPEGYNRFEVAQRLVEAGVVGDAASFVARTEDPALLRRLEVEGPSLEGYLFPDTYDLPLGLSADEVLERMVRTFRRRMDALRERFPEGFARAERAGLTARGVVTLASLVEEETGSAADRARVAAVFWNRLTFPEFDPRKLQSDPTITYGCRVAHPPSCPDAPPTGRLPITRAMRDDAANPYNTYQLVGLPPGPIANPGLRALEAVLAPAPTRDLYFVAMGDGRSAFAATLPEHQANVQRYLRGGARDH